MFLPLLLLCASGTKRENGAVVELHMAQVTKLFDGRNFLLQNWDCDECRGGKAIPEVSETSDIVFIRRGVFAYHEGTSENVIDSNRLLFITSGREYQISHPAENGDLCTVLSVKSELIGQVLSAVEAESSLDEKAPFAAPTAFAQARHYFAHWRLLKLVKERAPDIEIEEAVYRLVFQAFRSGARGSPVSSPTAKAHRELANSAMLILNGSLKQPIGLDGVARELGTSPFHLCRVFRRETGVGLGEYATELRLRAAVRDMLQSKLAVSAVAASYGFSSSSYFVYRFRLATGLTPSQYLSGIRPSYSSSGSATMFEAH